MLAFFCTDNSCHPANHYSQEKEDPLKAQIQAQIEALKSERQSTKKILKQWALSLILIKINAIPNATQEVKTENVFEKMARELAPKDINAKDPKTTTKNSPTLCDDLKEKIIKSHWGKKQAKEIKNSKNRLSPPASGITNNDYFYRRMSMANELELKAIRELAKKIQKITNSGIFSTRTNKLLEQCHQGELPATIVF